MDEIKIEAEVSEEDTTTSQVWNKLMGAALVLPGAKVNRTKFLTSQLRSHCSEEQVQVAIKSRPATAGVSKGTIDRLADGCINSHLLKTSAISFATGIPGGWAMAGSIPTDLVNFYWNAIVLSQKLAYLYGWPDAFIENDEVDDETKNWITLLIGSMMGASKANRAISEVAKRLAEHLTLSLPRRALTKTVGYSAIRQIARWIGIQVTKASFARGISRVVPVIGGFASAGVTVLFMRPMARRLKKHLQELYLAQTEGKPGEVPTSSDL